MQIRNVMCLLLATIGVLTSHQTKAESWDYQTYNRSGPAAPGYVTLEDKEGQSRITIVAPQMDLCYQGYLKATVDRTDQTIVITVAPKLSGCDEIRFVIKTDGTGGTRQVKRGEQWVQDGVNRLLTIRK